MGKKYTIELEDSESVYKTIIANGYPMLQVIVPAPYAEPDMEQVRKEGYQKGYETAKYECEDCRKIKADAEQELADKAYQMGLNDAWDAARKICLNVEEGGLSGGTVNKIFGVEYYRDALKDYSPSETIEKIRQYEQRQEEQDGLRQNIQTIVDQCGYTLDEIAEALQKMKES